MKILHLTAHYSPNLGGVETHLDDLVGAQIKEKYDIFVLTYRPLISDKKWKIREKKNRFEIFRIPWIPGLFYKLQANPVLELLYLAPPLFVFTPIIVLWKSIDVIQAHGLISSIVGVFWAKLLGKRIVTTTHSIYGFGQRGLYRKFVEWIFRNSDSVLVLSQQSKKEIEALGVLPNKIRVFTYWIDLKNFKPQTNTAKTKKDLGNAKQFIVFFVGRLVGDKGVGELLESAKLLPKEIALLIAGEGPMRIDVETAARANDNIKFVGRLDQKSLPLYYSLADVTIVPSTSEEGFGRVIIESLACGTPVIGSNRGGIPEAMDASVGKLIEITPLSIKKAIVGLYKDKKGLARLSKNARKYALKKYSEKNAETITKSYQS